MHASGNSVVELQTVIEKSVVLGLATNTASTSHSLADLMTTYASTLATQVRSMLAGPAGNSNSCVLQWAATCAALIDCSWRWGCSRPLSGTMLIAKQTLALVAHGRQHTLRLSAGCVALPAVALRPTGSPGCCAALPGDGARRGQHQCGCAQGQDLQVGAPAIVSERSVWLICDSCRCVHYSNHHHSGRSSRGSVQRMCTKHAAWCIVVVLKLR